jgi:serine/threonine-protein kinase
MHQRTVTKPLSPLPKPGDLLDDRFLIQHLVARTGVSAVYRAIDTRSYSLVAIKLVAPQQSSSGIAYDDALLMLWREVTLLRDLRRLDVPHLISVRTGIRHSYLATEWIDSQTLNEYLEQHKRSITELQLLALRLCLLVAQLHQGPAAIIHADLKPNNILIRPDGSPVLIDFGLARHTNTSLYGLQQIGTLGYASPEQLRGDVLTLRSDVYSLGRILAELFGPYRTRPQLRITWGVIQQAMAHNPYDRYANATQLHQALAASWQRPTHHAARGFSVSAFVHLFTAKLLYWAAPICLLLFVLIWALALVLPSTPPRVVTPLPVGG